MTLECAETIPTFVDGIATIDLSVSSPESGIGTKYHIYPYYVHAVFGANITRYISIIGATIKDDTKIILRAANLEVSPSVGINTSSFYVKILFFKYKI